VPVTALAYAFADALWLLVGDIASAAEAVPRKIAAERIVQVRVNIVRLHGCRALRLIRRWHHAASTPAYVRHAASYRKCRVASISIAVRYRDLFADLRGSRVK
jgi:hypothetical protein